ncbi:HopW family type III effector protein [Pseudomonas syringae pv. actinidifoliorum]|uniref:HopW family type III effector protein n=1 Tax=Pseudomonas syringae TaxID=317 RepID=UPI00137271F9|nr:HopW family type III effector protein [Pseudomonas syringae]MDU8432347.1 HopW family type III effector protein [Pseudomonas syringae pv. actinidifoliorum]MDU8522717.1 HopW family type III effector protein [Pseudomonas syringae pv. actinidifoliorum]MDU8529221.1 HopW family type III effector protein [Pseudomonas syringae pv. actinidifoliorum]NAS96087.1 restriction endonuclease [Pseudomonas syringae pv. actinidifoliorum]NAT63233.1 restriction endonuclease [Pseudomonas syringae pv. actinidifoli
MPPQITRSSYSSLPDASHASSDAASSLEQSPQQVRTKAFVASGKLDVAFGSRSTAPAQDSVHLLATFRRELAKKNPSYPAVAQLGQELADAAMTEQGWHQLANGDQQQALKEAFDDCTRQLADTPESHASHAPLSQACEGLKTARLHQSVALFTGKSHIRARGVADLLAFIHLDPKVLAEKPEGTTPYASFGSFIRTAKDRTAELISNLRDHSEEMTGLLRPHGDTLEALETLPAALASLIEHCPDTPTQSDLRSLAEAVGELLAELRKNDLLPASEERVSDSGESSVHSREVVEPRLTRGLALLKAGGNLVRKFDAYGAVAPMDDKKLLALLRRPAPHLSPEQMHAFLNKHAIHLTEEQRTIVSDTPLSFAREEDIEARGGMGFDEKFRLALANGSLLLTEEQLADLENLPKATTATSEGLKPLLEKPSPALTEAEREMLGAIVQANGQGQLDAWRAHNDRLPEVLNRSGLPPQVREELLSLNKSMNTELATLKDGASFMGRVAASPVMLLALAPLPLAVAFVSKDNSYSSSLVAHFTKNAVFMAGLMMNELTNSRTNIDHGLNRYFVTVLANAIVAQPTFAKNEHLLEQVGFGIAAAVTSGAATLAVFNRESIASAFKLAKSKFSSPDTGDASISDEDHRAVVNHFNVSEHFAQQMKVATEAYKQDNNITDIMNSSLTYLGTKSSEFKAAFEAGDAIRAGLELPETERKADADFYPKLGLVALTAGIGAALVMLMKSMVGKADYAADGVWCASEMLKLAINPEVDMQKAVQVFKEIVGLNLVMTGFLGVNKAWNFLDKGLKGYAAGATVLTAANLTLPGMVGEVAGAAAGKGLSYMTEKGKKAASWAGNYVSTSRLGGAASALSTAIPGRIAGGQMVAGLYDRFRYVTWSHSTPAAQATGEQPLDRQPSGSDRV